MNERIQELAKQAGISILWEYDGYDGHAVVANLKDIEKFAELIVKKFDDILLLQQLDSIGNHDRKSAELIEKIRDNTKTYFGVEE